MRITIADMTIDASVLFPDTEALCRDYLAAPNAPADFTFNISSRDITAEREVGLPGEWSDGYLETFAVYRAIAEWLPTRERMVMHGAVVAFEGRGYLFCAPSGTGKSTHIALWRRHLGESVQVVNGDKPIVYVPAAGQPVAYGTPWAGKEGWQRNTSVPLAGICFLAQGDHNVARRIEPVRCLDQALRQVYLPANAQAAGLTLDLLDRLLARVPLCELSCTISEDAVQASFEALTGLSYRSHKRA